jgi:hypothetical protein
MSFHVNPIHETLHASAILVALNSSRRVFLQMHLGLGILERSLAVTYVASEAAFVQYLPSKMGYCSGGAILFTVRASQFSLRAMPLFNALRTEESCTGRA